MRISPLIISVSIMLMLGAGCGSRPTATAVPSPVTPSADQVGTGTVSDEAEYEKSIEEITQEDRKDIERLRLQEQSELSAEQQEAIETPASEGVTF